MTEPKTVTNAALDKLPLFATDLEIAIAIVGKQHASHWKRIVLPMLEARHGFPRYDKLHEGRPVPLVKRFYDSYLGVSADYLSRGADGEENWEAWTVRRRKPADAPPTADRPPMPETGPRRTKQQKYDDARANSEAWAEKKRKALEEFRAKKGAGTKKDSTAQD